MTPDETPPPPPEAAAPPPDAEPAPPDAEPARRRRIALPLLVVLALLAGAAAYFVTRTATGRDVALNLIRDAISDGVQGDVRIGPALSGNVVTDLTVSRFEIRDAEGELFLALDTVTIAYDPLALLRRELRIRRLHARALDLHLTESPDGTWNFDRIFSSAPAASGGGAAASTPGAAATSGPAGATLAALGGLRLPSLVARGQDADGGLDADVGQDDGGGGDGGGLRLGFQDVTLASGRIRIRTPWTARLSGSERDQALREARAGESPWALYETPEGEFDNLYELSNLRGRLPVLRISDPETPLVVELDNVSGRLLAVRQPLDVERLSGRLALGDTADIRVEQLQTPRSLVRGTGWMTGSNPVQYEFDLDAEPLDVRDLRWLPIRLPEVGGGPMRVGLRSRGPTAVVNISNGDFRTGDTRLTGGFGLALGPRPRFEGIDVTVTPFALHHLEQLLGRSVGAGPPDAAAPPADEAAPPGDEAAAAVVRAGTGGWVRGTIRGAGYVNDLTVDADLTLEGAAPETLPSRLTARGGIAFGMNTQAAPAEPGTAAPIPAEPGTAAPATEFEIVGVDGLEVTLYDFEPRWMELLDMDLGIGGRFGGTLTLDGERGGAVAFAGSVDHRTQVGDLSRFTGSGRLDLDGEGVDAALEAGPLSLSLLRPWASGVDLAGNVTGPIRARGRRDALLIDARLESDRGGLTLNGEFDLTSEDMRYDTRIEGTGLSLDRWIAGAPASQLDIRGRVAGAGIDPATLEATFDLDLLPSRVDQAQIFDSHLSFRIADGLAMIDSLFLAADVGVLSARGDFGLTEDREGSVAFEANVLELSQWDRWFEDEIPGAAEAEAGQPLFDTIDAALGVVDDTPVEGLDGRLTARGRAFGRLRDYTVAADVEAQGARFRRHRAEHVQAEVEFRQPPGAPGFRARLAATGAELSGRPVDSVFVSLDRAPETAASGTAAGTVAEAAAAVTDATLYARRDDSIEFSARAGLTTGDVWSADVSELRLRLGKLESRLDAPARLSYSESGLDVEDLLIEGQLGRLRAGGHIPATGDGALSVELFGVRVDQLGLLASESSVLGGTLGGAATMAGTLAAPTFAGTLDILRPSVRNQTFGALNARFAYANRLLRGNIDLVDEGQTLGRLGGSVATDLSLVDVERRLLDDPLNLDLTGDRLPLALVELAVDGLEAVTGTADTDVRMRGSPARLRYSGDVRLADGRAWVPNLGVWLTDVAGVAEFRDSSLAHIDSVHIASDLGGTARLRGTVDIARIRDPIFALDIEAFAFRGVSRSELRLAVDGAGRLDGRYTDPLLTGDFVLTDGDLEQDEFLRAREVFDLGDLIARQAATERRGVERFLNPFMENLVVDARVALGPELWLRSPQLDVELASEGLDVYLDRGTDSIYVMGEVELTRGTYRVEIPPYVRPLRITNGAIAFVGDPEFNPNLDITAEYRDRTIDGPVVVEAHIAGPLRTNELVLTSNPPMSDTDKWCLLAVGTPCYRSADPQLGGRLMQAFLSPFSSGINAALVGTTGLSYFNVTSISTRGPGGVAANRNVFERTAVEFGWYANNDLFFSFWQPLGGGPPRATLEWSFLPSWSVEARMASRFDERLFGLSWGTNIANDRTFRLFLFREWTLGGGSP